MSPLVAEQGPVGGVTAATQEPRTCVRPVIPGLVLGEPCTPAALPAAAQAGVTHVVCDTAEPEALRAASEAQLAVMAVTPIGPRDYLLLFDAAYTFVDRAREGGGCVFVDSASPVAVACTAAFLMKKYGHSLHDALELVQLADQLDAMLLAQLRAYEDAGCTAPARAISPRSLKMSPRTRRASPPAVHAREEVAVAALQAHKPRLVLQPVPKSAFVNRAPVCLSAH